MFIECFHGTSQDRASSILENGFLASNRDGLWIGPGRYFFQEAPGHAIDWARFKGDMKGQAPAVFKAKVTLNGCLDLLDNGHWEGMKALYEMSQTKAPRAQPSLLEYLRDTDKAIIRHYDDDWLIRLYIKSLQRLGRKVWSVRCSIPEGNPVFENSWLLDKSCVMVNVLEPDAIVDYELVV